MVDVVGTLRDTRDVIVHKLTRHSSLNADALDLVVIAFNNATFIEYQHRLLMQNLQDQHFYTVADNSSDLDASRSIEAYCRTNGVAYVRVPSAGTYTGSPSHAKALNWVWHNYLRERCCTAFGFLDHDIFPIRPTQVMQFLARSSCYGLVQERGDRWYLWPGFCFYLFSSCGHRRLDFGPASGLDTGGANWEPLYRFIPRKVMRPITQRYAALRDGTDPQLDLVEYLADDWVHIINGSDWKRGDGIPKSQLAEALLEDFCRQAALRST